MIPADHRGCPDCDGAGWHTFDIEVECDGPIGANIASTDGTFRRLYRASVVEGMVQEQEDGTWRVQLKIHE